MKDAYSIDADLAQLNTSYDAMYEAYCRIFDRCGLPYVIVEAESGPIGGDSSHEFMVPCSTGEDKVIQCVACGYAANQERAEVGAKTDAERPQAADAPPYEAVADPEQADDPGRLRVPEGRRDDLRQAARLPGRRQARRRPRAGRPRAERGEVPPGDRCRGGRPGRRGHDREGDRGSHGLPRPGRDQDPARDRPGDRRDAHGRRRRQRRRRPPQGRRARARLPAGPGPRHPQRRRRRPLPALREAASRSSRAWRSATSSSSAPSIPRRWGRPTSTRRGNEIHVIMGCYGIGINRIVAGAVEAAHDANGIIWPLALAPYHVLVVPLQGQNAAVMEHAQALEKALTAAGLDVLVDDRDQRPGVKFKDADLIGVPLRVVIGERGFKEGKIEVKWRNQSEAQADPGRRPPPRRSSPNSRRPVSSMKRFATSGAGPRGREGVMSTPQPTARLPYVLLGAMTLVSFGGPLVLLVRCPRRQEQPSGRPTGRSSGRWPSWSSVWPSLFSWPVSHSAGGIAAPFQAKATWHRRSAT